MARILFLPHRLPYPPDKGDKIRSYHLLRHLAARHEVTLATFVDDAADEAHLPALRAWCRAMHVARLHPRRARAASLLALLGSGPLTLRYYHDATLLRWVVQEARRSPFDCALVFSSSMVPYAQALPGTPMLLDLVDVDSAKWASFAQHRRWPLSWPFAREGRTLLAFERRAVSQAHRTYLCTEQERELFLNLAPEARGRVDVLRNGVDADHYSPDPRRPSPFEPGERPIVFTGAMDYWPNADAVAWFAAEVLPALRARFGGARFHIVGRNPTPAVKALAGDAVRVTGTVPDVRPYLQHAAVVVAPMRVARGIQNKILEAMAMARPVVCTTACAGALDARVGGELLAAQTPHELMQATAGLLEDAQLAHAIGAAGRERVLRTYAWEASLQILERHLAEAARNATPARADASAAPMLEGS
jgi:sugar transferase (PEP-CTERM/EpsH1 system associated)